MVGTVLGALTYVIMFLFYNSPVGFIFLSPTVDKETELKVVNSLDASVKF